MSHPEQKKGGIEEGTAVDPSSSSFQFGNSAGCLALLLASWPKEMGHVPHFEAGCANIVERKPCYLIFASSSRHHEPALHKSLAISLSMTLSFALNGGPIFEAARAAGLGRLGRQHI